MLIAISLRDQKRVSQPFLCPTQQGGSPKAEFTPLRVASGAGGRPFALCLMILLIFCDALFFPWNSDLT